MKTYTLSYTMSFIDSETNEEIKQDFKEENLTWKRLEGSLYNMQEGDFGATFYNFRIDGTPLALFKQEEA